MFLKLRKGLYLLLGLGSVGGAVFALAGLLTSLFLFVAGLTHGEWAGAATGLGLTLMCAAGATGPVWILMTVILLPNPSPKERRLLSGLLSAAIVAAGAVAAAMLLPGDGDAVGIETPLVLFLLPMLVGLALLIELWLPVWRVRLRGEPRR